MQYVPVVSSNGRPLMPCHPARARELVRNGKAVRRFNKGIFYIRLCNRMEGQSQPTVMGIDPGSKKEAITVKSENHTYLNIQADAITWVRDAVERRAMMRHSRRQRKCPHRPNRMNRARGGIPPSTKARWQWKLRLARWLCGLYPITDFVVEDVAARTTQKRRWNVSFSPLEVGKHWFYNELGKLGHVETMQGWETKQQRDALGLKKSSKKMADVFDAHCVDSWVLANWWIGGHQTPDSTKMLLVIPLQFHRRQLHNLQPDKNGNRRLYGGTRSLGFKRGSWVKHPKWGTCYVGGTSNGRISLYCLQTGQRLTQTAKPMECQFLCYASWREAKRG